MHFREILFTPRCSPRARKFLRFSQLFYTRYDVRLRSYGASKLPNFRILAYFSHTKSLKRTFRWPAYSPYELHRRMHPIFPCGRWKSKGVPSGRGLFMRLLVRKLGLGTPKLAQIFAYGKWLCIQNATELCLLKRSFNNNHSNNSVCLDFPDDIWRSLFRV